MMANTAGSRVFFEFCRYSCIGIGVGRLRLKGQEMEIWWIDITPLAEF